MMIGALFGGLIAGAGLDVTDPESLAPDSPHWADPSVILTGHNSAGSPHQEERGVVLFQDNSGRYLAGEPLRNMVDLAAGY
jgi:phosphoglycerate dehydrogenase-like enzyme